MKSYTNWIPSIIFASIIFIVSSLPGEVINEAGLGNNILHINGHFFLFAALSLSLYKATKNYKKAVFLSIFYGFLDEFHQIFTPNRSVSMQDILVDTAGSLVGVLIAWKSHVISNKLKSWLEK